MNGVGIFHLGLSAPSTNAQQCGCASSCASRCVSRCASSCASTHSLRTIFPSSPRDARRKRPIVRRGLGFPAAPAAPGGQDGGGERPRGAGAFRRGAPAVPAARGATARPARPQRQGEPGGAAGTHRQPGHRALPHQRGPESGSGPRPLREEAAERPAPRGAGQQHPAERPGAAAEAEPQRGQGDGAEEGDAGGRGLPGQVTGVPARAAGIPVYPSSGIVGTSPITCSRGNRDAPSRVPGFVE